MIKFREFISRSGLDLDETGPYQWRCFGRGAHIADLSNPHNGMSLVTDFDRVFYLDIYFKDAIVVYVDDEYKEAYFKEGLDRGIDIHYNHDMYEMGDRIPYIYVSEDRILELVEQSIIGDLYERFFDPREYAMRDADLPCDECIDENEVSRYTVTVELSSYASSHAEAVSRVESALSSFNIKSIETRSDNNV